MARPLSGIFKDPAKLEEAKRLAARGFSISMIAEKLGTTPSMVTNTFIRNGIKTNWSLNKKDGGNRPIIGKDPHTTYNVPLTPDQDKAIGEFIEKGFSYGDVQRTLGYNVDHIRGAVRRLGIQSHGSRVYLERREKKRQVLG